MISGKILVVDDQPKVRRVMRVALVDHGYEVFDSRTGEEALIQFRKIFPDLILLDLNMPGMGGFEVCREVRTFSEAPIIVFSVRNSEKDIVEALDAGADEYLIKPFGMEELLARIRAAFRRARAAETTQPRLLMMNWAEIDFEGRLVTTPAGKVHLSPKEFEVLRHLVSNKGRVVSHRKLLQSVWGPDYGDEVDYLRVVVNQLRKKIERDPSNPEVIITEARVGYCFLTPQLALKNS